MAIIWTNHSIERAKQRGIPQSWIEKTINSPDNSFDKGDKSMECHKKFDNQTVTVIIKENELGQYIILSCWIDPPNYGTADFRKNKNYHDMKKASLLKKFWLTLRGQIGF